MNVGTGAESMSDGVISFRDISPSDMALLYVWRMESGTRLMFRHTEVVPFEFHRARVERHMQGGRPDRWFIIEAAEKPVGTISLYNFSEDSKTCEWGRFIIAPEARNVGYGRRALKLLTRYAQSIGVKRLNCEVLESNRVALRLYRELGFFETGAQDCAGRTFLSMTADLDSHQ
jgi:RimJ/RimL family protein N-acetyltransferase